MYFWRIQALKQELVAGSLSDRQVLPYLVAWSAFSTLVLSLPNGPQNTWDIASNGWSVFLAVAGTIYVYLRNGGIAGQDLLPRILTISWVVSLRILSGLTCIIVIYVGVADLVSEVPENTTWQEAVVFSLAETLVYWRTGHHISAVANASGHPSR